MTSVMIFAHIVVAAPPGSGTIAAILNVWFVCWAVRRRGDLDLPLDFTAKAVRWTVAISCLSYPFAFPRLVDSAAFRICIGLTGMVFLCWPNLALRLTGLLRRVGFLPRNESPDPTI